MSFEGCQYGNSGDFVLEGKVFLWLENIINTVECLHERIFCQQCLRTQKTVKYLVTRNLVCRGGTGKPASLSISLMFVGPISHARHCIVRQR